MILIHADDKYRDWIDATLPRSILEIGWCGVNIFFVLSGFLITSILLKSFSNQGYLKNFYGRRALRIFPLYFGFLSFLYCMSLLYHGSDALNDYRTKAWWLFLYLFSSLPELFNKQYYFSPWLGHFWSLSVEEHFYLFWPFLLLICRTFKLMTIAFLCIYASSLIIRVMVFRDISPEAAYVFTFSRIDALVLGGICALMFKRFPANYFIGEKAKAILVAAFALVTIAVLFAPSGGTDRYIRYSC